jgi:hypothetical protein
VSSQSGGGLLGRTEGWSVMEQSCLGEIDEEWFERDVGVPTRI